MAREDSTRLEPAREARFWAAAEEATRFFMGDANVQRAARRLARLLEEAAIPYAVVGALALNEAGYRRTTVHVDVLLTRAGLATLKGVALGRGYVEKLPRSKGLRDTENNVVIDVLLAGDYPGDGKPKAVAFPDPALWAVKGSEIAILPVFKLVELKLASGMSAPHRLKDLADVLELIRAAGLPRELTLQLDPSVRDKYEELWRAAQVRDEE